MSFAPPSGMHQRARGRDVRGKHERADGSPPTHRRRRSERRRGDSSSRQIPTPHDEGLGSDGDLGTGHGRHHNRYAQGQGKGVKRQHQRTSASRYHSADRDDMLGDDSDSEREKSLDESAAVDVEAIVKERDFKTLERNLVNLTFCNVELEQSPALDGNYLKVMKLLQLMVECLLYAQKDLKEDSKTQKNKRKDAERKLADTENALSKLEQKSAYYKQEMRSRKGNILMLQSLLQKDTSVQQCPYCPKQFVNQPLLSSHIERRHPQCAASAIPRPVLSPASQQENLAPRVTGEVKDEETPKLVAGFQESIRVLTKRLEESEEQFQASIKEREAQLNRQHQEAIADMRNDERKKHDDNLKAAVGPLEAKIEQLVATQHQQQVLMQKSLSSAKVTSNLGDIEDDDSEVEQQRSRSRKQEKEMKRLEQEKRRQEQEIQDLRSTLQEQVSAMKLHQDQQKEEMRARMLQVEQQYRHELEQARNEAQLSHSAAIRAEQLIGEERRRLSQEQELREEAYNQKAQDMLQHEARLTQLQKQTSRQVPAAVGDVQSQDLARGSHAAHHASSQRSATKKSTDPVVVPVGQRGPRPELSSLSGTRSRGASHAEVKEESTDSETGVVQAAHASQRHYSVEVEGASLPSGRTGRQQQQETPASYPMPTNPLIKTRFNHTPAVVSQTRAEVTDTIEVEMKRLGVRPNVNGLKMDDFEAKMKILQKSRLVHNADHQSREDLRNQLRQQVETLVDHGYDDWKKTRHSKHSVPKTVQRPPTSPDKDQGKSTSRSLRKGPPPLRAKTPLAASSSTPGGRVNLPSQTPKHTATTPSTKESVPLHSSQPPSTMVRHSVANVARTPGIRNPSDTSTAAVFSDSASSTPLSDDSGDDAGLQRRQESSAPAQPRVIPSTPPVITQPSPTPAPRVTQVSASDDSHVYATPLPRGGIAEKEQATRNSIPALREVSPGESSDDESEEGVQPANLPRAVPVTSLSTAPNAGHATGERHQSKPTTVRGDDGDEDGDEEGSSWDESLSELNDLLHNSVGAPSSTQKHQASAHSGDSRQAAAQKRSASSNVRLQSSAVTEEGVPRAGTGRVKDLAASLGSSLGMSMARPPAGGVDLRGPAKQNPITMAGGHDVDEDSYSVSSFDADDLAPSVTAKAQSKGAGYPPVSTTGNSATGAQARSLFRDGTASGQASLGAGSSIGVSSINVEEISDLSDDDDW